MSMTDEKKNSKDLVATAGARALRKELFSDELLDRLMSRVDESGVSLSGKGGSCPSWLRRSSSGGWMPS